MCCLKIFWVKCEKPWIKGFNRRWSFKRFSLVVSACRSGFKWTQSKIFSIHVHFDGNKNLLKSQFKRVWNPYKNLDKERSGSVFCAVLSQAYIGANQLTKETDKHTKKERPGQRKDKKCYVFTHCDTMSIRGCLWNCNWWRSIGWLEAVAISKCTKPKSVCVSDGSTKTLIEWILNTVFRL